MIRLNENYVISNGRKNVITFTEGRSNTINANYGDGVINGTLDGNVLTGHFHNTKNNTAGTIQIEFNETGFTSTWKASFEPGTPRGKWEAQLINEPATV